MQPDLPLTSTVQMSFMEARYQVSSVLFVAPAHLGVERHDEAIATPSALSYLNAVGDIRRRT